MTNSELYLSSLKVIEKMKKEGIINDSDFDEADAFLMKKYGIKITSFISPSCLCKSIL